MSYGSAEELYDLGIALDRVIYEHNLPSGGTATERFARIVDHFDSETCRRVPGDPNPESRRRHILADSLPWRMGEAD